MSKPLFKLAHPFCPVPCFASGQVVPTPPTHTHSPPGGIFSCPCSTHFHPQGDRVRCTKMSGQRDDPGVLLAWQGLDGRPPEAGRHKLSGGLTSFEGYFPFPSSRKLSWDDLPSLPFF